MHTKLHETAQNFTAKINMALITLFDQK